MGSYNQHSRSDTRVSCATMRILLLSLLVSFVVCQSPEAQEPPPGQRCSGRNYNGRRCCTPEKPCGLGEGDCDGPLDGGTHDGHQGCRGDLVCGSNNCRKFGAYFHEKDDCCERATSPLQSSKSPEFDRNEKQGWGPWSSWGPCSHTCAAGRKTRQRQCLGKCKNH